MGRWRREMHHEGPELCVGTDDGGGGRCGFTCAEEMGESWNDTCGSIWPDDKGIRLARQQGMRRGNHRSLLMRRMAKAGTHAAVKPHWSFMAKETLSDSQFFGTEYRLLSFRKPPDVFFVDWIGEFKSSGWVLAGLRYRQFDMSRQLGSLLVKATVRLWPHSGPCPQCGPV